MKIKIGAAVKNTVSLYYGFPDRAGSFSYPTYTTISTLKDNKNKPHSYNR